MFRNGNAISVRGPVPPDDLGITLTHEHISLQFDVSLKEAYPGIQYPPSDKSAFQLKNLGVIRQYPYGLHYNLRMDDVDTDVIIEDELKRFKNLGGKTIVENTTHGIARRAEVLKKLSQACDIHIIAGTGYYIAPSQVSTTLTSTVEEIQKIMITELTEGVPEDATIRCGVIGEIGISWPMHNFENSVIQAVALAQAATNAPVTFHPGRNPESPFEIIRIFAEAGGNPQDVVMSHLDRTIFDSEKLLDFAKLGTFTQFDLFGIECSHYQLQEEVDMPSDAQRIQSLRVLKDDGYLNKILISHDIHTKHRLANFGGHGYGHILENVVPKMRFRGFSQQDIDTILISNPKRWLTGSL